MDNERQHALSGLTGLPPLPKSLSTAPATGSSARSSPSLHAANANTTIIANDLFLGPSTSAAAAATRQRYISGTNMPATGNDHRHGSLSSTQESLSDRESIHSRASSTHSSQHQQQHTPTNMPQIDASLVSATGSTLDHQLAVLRREMYGLRQLDLNLLSQLWALNESIQGFRVFLQEQDALSPPTRSHTPSDENSLSSEVDEEEEDDDESYALVPKHAQPVLATNNKLPTGSTTSHASTSSASGTSGSSSAASSMGKHHHHHHQPQYNQQHLLQHHQQKQQRPNAAAPPPPLQNKAHPQLPRILQQRMRHAPPPPPPTRPASKSGSNSSSNHSINSMTQQFQHFHLQQQQQQQHQAQQQQQQQRHRPV